MKVIAILQPGYLPWLGFFEQMQLADHFVYLDDVQFTRKDWRNRNRIKIGSDIHFITVPVVKSPIGTQLREIEISSTQPWQEKNLAQIRSGYEKAPYFKQLFEELTTFYSRTSKYLWELDVQLVEIVRQHLDIDTPISYSSEVPRRNAGKNERILEICKYYDGDVLYDGQSAADFIDQELFETNGIEVVFQNYIHPVYSQRVEPFISHLSIIDLLFNTGPDAKEILLSSPAPDF